jgi:hypothetical protein
MMIALLAPALAQQPGSSSTAKPKTAAATGTPNRVAKFVAPSVIGDSYITEDKFGRVGIGTATPTSPLTVQGMIEMTLGGLKFPDGTVQTSAAVKKVIHDTRLTGDGTSGSPLGVSVPLILNGASSGGIGVIEATNTSENGTGVVGNGGNGGVGVVGLGGSRSSSSAGAGLFGIGGDSVNGAGGGGVAGLGGSGLVNGYGVSGRGGVSIDSSGGDGVEARGGDAFAAGKSGGIGILAEGGEGFNGAARGLAGKFLGNVQVTGTLSKAGGSFRIDHPLDPENKYLSHSFVESPDMKNIYDGVVSLDGNGEATVEMPEWFSALNHDFRYLLTALGAPMPGLYVAKEIENNRFRIAGGAPGMKVSWQVTGIRQDAWANQHRIPVEEVKSEKERGLYLHPEAFGQPEERGLASAHRSEGARQREGRKTEQPQQPK